jgi:RNA polymerase sigma-70 factor (ECF subfamily)
LDSTTGEITRLLRAASEGDKKAENELLGIVYPALLKMARGQMKHERASHTLQPTALVHETYLRLAGAQTVDWRSRAQFFAMAATAMRRILVDYARERNAAKRQGGRLRVEYPDDLTDSNRLDDILQVDKALARLSEWNQRQSKIVELRFFVGLTFEEIAEIMDISLRSVKRDWSIARAFLYGEISPSGDSAQPE